MKQVSRLIQLSITALILLVFLISKNSTVYAEVRQFPNQPGWIWQIQPIDNTSPLCCINGFVISREILRSGDLSVSVANSSDKISGLYDFRVIGFDSCGNRFEFENSTGGSTENVSLHTFVMPSNRLNCDRLAYFGIEALTLDNLRDVIAPNAFKQLQQMGESALPFPQIGKPYAFQIKCADGMIINSRNFLGKVILLDFWATWCNPCMKKMPMLKQIYSELHSKGFEVIGINHDFTIEKAQEALLKADLPWHEVIAPIGLEKRNYWKKALGISSLPRLLIIDRKGILRSDVNTLELEKEIRRIVSR